MPVPINFLCLSIQVQFFSGTGTGGPKRTQGHPCRTLVAQRNRDDALGSNEPRFGVYLDRRAVHHALRRVDCADVDLPVAPAISDALTPAQKLLGGTAGQAGEKCDQDGHATRGPGRCPAQRAVAARPQPQPGVLRVHPHPKKPSCARRRVCPPPPESSVNNNLELTTLSFRFCSFYFYFIIYIYCLAKLRPQSQRQSYCPNSRTPALPSSFNIAPTCGAPTPIHILSWQGNLVNIHSQKFSGLANAKVSFLCAVFTV